MTATGKNGHGDHQLVSAIQPTTTPTVITSQAGTRRRRISPANRSAADPVAPCSGMATQAIR